jgi:hypothetical protein
MDPTLSHMNPVHIYTISIRSILIISFKDNSASAVTKLQARQLGFNTQQEQWKDFFYHPTQTHPPSYKMK